VSRGTFEPALYQLAAGAALAIGVVGVVHTGRDLWLGLALIVMAGLFGARAWALDESRRAGEIERLHAELGALAREHSTLQSEHGVLERLRRLLG
jgi:hypothetical protein